MAEENPSQNPNQDNHHPTMTVTEEKPATETTVNNPQNVVPKSEPNTLRLGDVLPQEESPKEITSPDKEVTGKTPKRRPGRPKGSKNKRPRVKKQRATSPKAKTPAKKDRTPKPKKEKASPASKKQNSRMSQEERFQLVVNSCYRIECVAQLMPSDPEENPQIQRYIEARSKIEKVYTETDNRKRRYLIVQAQNIMEDIEKKLFRSVKRKHPEVDFSTIPEHPPTSEPENLQTESQETETPENQEQALQENPHVHKLSILQQFKLTFFQLQMWLIVHLLYSQEEQEALYKNIQEKLASNHINDEEREALQALANTYEPE